VADLNVIRSYRDRKSERFAEGERIPAFEGFRHQAEKRLRVLEAAGSLRELGQLRSNRLEALSGDRKGQYSVRINSQWRICFEWPRGGDGPENVEIVDYH
jgi:proteic killer suppression protein